MDADTQKALEPKVAYPVDEPSLKRKRALSTTSAELEALLPTSAEKFYTTAASADLPAVRRLCAPACARAAAQQVAGVLASKVHVGTMHVSTRTLTVSSELHLEGSKAMHKLTFNEEGLVTSTELYTELPTVFEGVPSPKLSATSAQQYPPSGE